MPGISRRKLTVSAIAALLLATGALSSVAAPAASAASSAGSPLPRRGLHTLTLANGSTLRWTDDGTATVTSKAGTTKTLPMPRSAGRSGLGATYGPSELSLMTRATSPSFELGATTAATTAAARITTMNTGPVVLPKANQQAVKHNLAAAAAAVPRTQAASLPGNGALSSSFDSYLNAQGVNAVGTFADDAKYLKGAPRSRRDRHQRLGRRPDRPVHGRRRRRLRAGQRADHHPQERPALPRHPVPAADSHLRGQQQGHARPDRLDRGPGPEPGRGAA